jgi:hypothetical protein
VKTSGTFAIVVDIIHEEPEIVKYLNVDAEKVRKFMPDLALRGRIAKCISLVCKRPPEPGEDVELADFSDLREIHFSNGEFCMPYLTSLIRKCRDRLWIVKEYLNTLMDAIPEEREVIEIIRAEVEYGMLRGVEL